MEGVSKLCLIEKPCKLCDYVMHKKWITKVIQPSIKRRLDDYVRMGEIVKHINLKD